MIAGADCTLELGLSPLAVAILSNSEDDVRLILANHPHYIEHRTFGMTVFHLSCQWPAGLSLLISTGLVGLIDELCEGLTLEGFTAVEFALFFKCAEAASLLFDAGCTWRRFHNTTLTTDCVRTVARHLAGRRRGLRRLAEKNLTKTQLSAVEHGAGVLDSNAAAVQELLS